MQGHDKYPLNLKNMKPVCPDCVPTKSQPSLSCHSYLQIESYIVKSTVSHSCW